MSSQTAFTIAVTDAPDATGHYRAFLLSNPSVAGESISRDRAAVACLLAALESYPPPANEAAG